MLPKETQVKLFHAMIDALTRYKLKQITYLQQQQQQQQQQQTYRQNARKQIICDELFEKKRVDYTYPEKPFEYTPDRMKTLNESVEENFKIDDDVVIV
jgi:hypothetical protein